MKTLREDGGVFQFEGPGQGRLPERLTVEQVPGGDEGRTLPVGM